MAFANLKLGIALPFFSNGGEDLRLSCGVSVFTRLRLLEGTSPNPELQPQDPKPYL